MNRELQESLKQNVMMWKLWQQRGVTESTELEVDYHFFCPGKKSMEALSEKLRKSGFRVRVNQRRVLFFFKVWDVEATTTPQQWSLLKLDDETEKWFKIADDCNADFDGMGAMI